MKAHFKKFLVMILAVAGVQTLSAAPAAAPAAKPKVEIPKSVFVIPTAPNQGRDPFFPNSQRPYISRPSNNVDSTELSRLRVKSILPSGNRAFAIIENHTFGPGDDGVVTTATGQRLTVHCLDINVAAGTVTIESSGARAVLRFSSR